MNFFEHFGGEEKREKSFLACIVGIRVWIRSGERIGDIPIPSTRWQLRALKQQAVSLKIGYFQNAKVYIISTVFLPVCLL